MSIHKLTITPILVGLVGLTASGCGDDAKVVVDAPAGDAADAAVVDTAAPADAPGFTLESSDLASGTFSNAQILNSSAFGCAGENHSPALRWSNPPAGTRSFAITLFDPDAPTGSGFWHWTVFNIPAATTALASNAAVSTGGSLPAGAIQGYTDFGAPGYGGPCPPDGDTPHHYVFTIYALSVDSLGLSSEAPGALVTFSALSSSLGTAKLMATYGRGTPGTSMHPEPPTLASFTLASASITDGTIANEQVLNNAGLGCAGGNLSPELHWVGAPDTTKSFALTVHDPDAPTGSGFWHWLAFDIPATTKSLIKGAGSGTSVFPGKQGYNDLGVSAYAGPCPPVADGPHHYVFTLYALPVETLGLTPGSTGALLGFNARAMATAKATFTATYDR